MQAIVTRGICRQEQRETRWTFSGWATEDAHENTVRPRAYYRSCGSCRGMVLTMADVDDAEGFCRSVLATWLRRARHVRDVAGLIDLDNVLGELRLHLWYLYNKWVPGFGQGNGTFTGYASGIMSRKINTFVVRDVADSEGPGRLPKAHSRSLTESYEVVSARVSTGTAREGRAERGGLDFALGAVALDSTGDMAATRGWLLDARDSGDDGSASV